MLATLAVLVVVGLAAGAAGRRAGAWRHLLPAAGATSVAAWLIAAYVNDWTLRNWAEFSHTAAVAAAVALVPLSEIAVAAARARRAAARRWMASAVLVGALGWLAVLTVQYLPGWGPPLLGRGRMRGGLEHRRAEAASPR